MREAVILAAGRGVRLGALGLPRPKGFIELGGRPIIERSLDCLAAAGVERVVIVTGHQADFYRQLAARRPGIELVHNERYADSGSMYSLYLARDRVGSEFLLLESDLIYEGRALETLATEKGDALLVSGWTQSGDEVYVEARGDRLSGLSKRRTDLTGELIGELVGISRLSPACLQAMCAHAEGVFRETLKLEYEQSLVAAARAMPVRCAFVPDLAWAEIDDASHLERARQRVFPRIEELERFARDGFVVRRGLFSAAEMADVSTWIDRLVANPPRPGMEMPYFEDSLSEPGRRILSRIEKFADDGPFADFVRSRRILDPVEALLGARALLFKEKINFKLPGGGGFEPHQDVQPGWDGYAPYFLSVAIAVDPSTPENGCLELAAGQHRRGWLGERWKPLTREQLAGVHFESYPMAPGDAVFFDCFVPHRSAPNGTAEQRRNLYLTYHRAADGEQRSRYFADKRKSFPPDHEREPGSTYVYRV